MWKHEMQTVMGKMQVTIEVSKMMPVNDDECPDGGDFLHNCGRCESSFKQKSS